MPLPPTSPTTSRSAPVRIARRAFTGLVTALLAGCVPATDGGLGVEALSSPAPSQVLDNCYSDPGPLPFVPPPVAARVVEPGGAYTTVQSAVDAARPGDVILVRPGVYRESVTIRKPNLTLWGLPGAVISGANRLEGWTKDAQGAWSVAYSAPGSSGGQCRDGVNCGSALALYRDGRPMTRVSTTPGAGDFAYRNGRLELGSSPAGHVFEVPARAYWIKAEKADNITVRGLTFRVAVPPAQRGGLENNGGNNWVIEGNDLAFSHAAGAYLDGENVRFTSNRVHENGQEGVASGFSRGLKVNGNILACNNTAGYDPFWEAGGAKFSRAQGLTANENTVYGNDGPGLWCDIDCDGVEFSRNRASGNTRQGLHVEISRNATITGNVVWNNGRGDPYPGSGAGILLQNTSGSRVTGNTVAWNPVGIGVIEHDRGSGHQATGNEVSGNTIIGNGGSLISLVFTTGSGDESSNRVSGNRVWTATGQGFQAAGRPLDLNAFAGLTGGSVQLLSTSERDAALTAVGLPLKPGLN